MGLTMAAACGAAACVAPRPRPTYVVDHEWETSADVTDTAGGSGADDRRAGVERILAAHEQLTLDVLLTAAEAAHPGLRSAEAYARAAEGRAWQASLRPNPSLTLRREGPVEHPGIRRTENWIELAQPVAMGDRLARAEAAELASRDELLLAVDEERAAVHGAVRETFVELLALRARGEMLGAALALAREIDATAQRRVAARTALRTEELKTGFEVASLESELAATEGRTRSTAARLSGLLGGAGIDAARIVGRFAADVAARDAAADAASVRAGNPSVRRARARVDAAAAGVAAAEAAGVGDIELFVAGGYAGEQEHDRQVVELGVTIPLPFSDVNQGSVLAARRELRGARLAAEAVLADLLVRLQGLHADHDAARQRVAALATRLVPAAQTGLAQARQAYEAGSGGFLDLLDAQRTLTDLRRDHVDALRDAHVATARIRALTGDTP